MGSWPVVTTIWLSSHFPKPHELGTAKISFMDEKSEMLKDEVIS